MNTDWNRKMKDLIHREYQFTFVALRFQLGLAAIWYRIMPHLFSGDDYWKYCWSFWLIVQLLLSLEVRQVSVINKDKNSFSIHLKKKKMHIYHEVKVLVSYILLCLIYIFMFRFVIYKWINETPNVIIMSHDMNRIRSKNMSC